MSCRARVRRRVRHHAGALIVLLVTSACGPQPTVLHAPRPAPDPTAAARRLLDTGDYRGAALEYERLAAAQEAPAADRYAMTAVLAHQDAGDFASAAAALAKPPSGDPAAMRLRALAEARALVRDQLAERALAQLALVPPETLTPDQRRIYHHTFGLAQALQTHHAAAVPALLAADVATVAPVQKALLQHDIWNSVSHLRDPELQALATDRGAVAAGWAALAAVVNEHLPDSATFPEHIATWRQRFPGHPAQAEIAGELLGLAATVVAPPARVALLLPFEGTFAAAAAAIRDGFLTAWYADRRAEGRPVVDIYAADDTNIEPIYEQAAAQGAALIVGPLQKSAVRVLAQRPELRVPVLALNFTGVAPQDAAGTAKALAPGLYQFGLVPEDEARQVADRARADGHSRALVLAPASDWGRRLAGAFAARWRELGGVLLRGGEYSSHRGEYMASVRQTLNVDLSEARAATLRALLRRPIEFAPRRRADVDCIFLAAFPADARQILPHLRYFGVTELPVYATSHVFNGVVDAAHDHDLDGLVFGDMPWLVGAADRGSFEAVQRGWGKEAAGLRRLFAFGIDAYRLMPYLGRMRVQKGARLPGTTGLLSMDDTGRVYRGLTWLRFAGGTPAILDTGATVME